MKKWFIEVVRDINGKYHANMVVNGKAVEGLVRDVDYNTLRQDIKDKTGVKILPCQDMWWGSKNGKNYAYMDCTRFRHDSRVSLDEVRGTFREAWRPDFARDSERIDKQVVLGPYTYLKDFDDIYVDIGTVVDHKPGNIGEMCAYAGNDIVHLTERLYLDGRREALDETQRFYEQEILYDGDVHEVAFDKLSVVKSTVEEFKKLPLFKQPAAPCFIYYFDVMDYKSLSGAQLVFAKGVAVDYIGDQSRPVANIDREMVARFERENSFDNILSCATQRSQETEKSDVAKVDLGKIREDFTMDN